MNKKIEVKNFKNNSFISNQNNNINKNNDNKINYNNNLNIIQNKIKIEKYNEDKINKILNKKVKNTKFNTLPLIIKDFILSEKKKIEKSVNEKDSQEEINDGILKNFCGKKINFENTIYNNEKIEFEKEINSEKCLISSYNNVKKTKYGLKSIDYLISEEEYILKIVNNCNDNLKKTKEIDHPKIIKNTIIDVFFFFFN
jgi:hypothetical protein